MKIYFLADSISAIRGGLTSSLYKRANELSKNFKNVIILTFNSQSNIESVEDELKKIGKLDKNIIIKSFFHDQDNLNRKDVSVEKKYAQHGDNFTRIFNIEGHYIQYNKYTDNSKKKLQFIDYMSSRNPSNKVYREIYRNNIKSCIITYNEEDIETQKIILKNDHPFLNIIIKENEIKTFVFNEENIQNTTIENEHNKWIKTFIKSDDIIFFDDNLKKNLNIFKDINCKKIAFFHSHENHDKSSNFLKNSKDFDNYVFLTSKQLEKITQENKTIEKKYFLLPHYYKETINLPQDSRTNRIITISRLTKNKRIIDGIKAFSLIYQKFPNLTYEIYGKGPELENIIKEIKKLNLEDKIILKGYTQDPLKLFSESILSIALSEFEGFGLSILESLSMSCPVISYDIEYGPKELIKNNVNGFLCPKDDIESIATSIEKIILQNNYFQNNCISSIEQYSYEKWKNKLLELVK